MLDVEGVDPAARVHHGGRQQGVVDIGSAAGIPLPVKGTCRLDVPSFFARMPICRITASSSLVDTILSMLSSFFLT
jgi:hypothetical protein